MTSSTKQSKTIAIMQPYFFPYLGYLQLMASADSFIIYDDVQYIKQGWVNRNRILREDAPVYVTLPVVRGRHNERICEKRLHDPQESLRDVFAKIMRHYRSAPHFDEAVEFLEPLFSPDVETISDFNIRALRALCRHLGIATELVVASERHYGHDVRGQERVLRICEREAATHYVNAIGAKAIGLYSKEAFAAAGLELSFIRSRSDIAYDQGAGVFVPNLSVIDLLMHNAPETICRMLPRYTRVSG
jgi:hypothetical protein